ncbi:MAG: geranylgeranylglyceryl/heptaprenylglyceryl phosphate synthase [Bacteroidetes bacterium]|nr:geranylgeranylglyceryl/heptaprenylglyceryl phosphate synthase [Bacteroidota bacterium]MBU1720445.1 geranylgeranylglyceryl/heptaprenylglyceryl phosphate synthase [Bacteroidota bacterium]
MENKISELIAQKISNRIKMFAVLVDPGNTNAEKAGQIAAMAQITSPDFILVGGSLLMADNMEACIAAIRNNCDIPIVIFPGSTMQVSSLADAILFLSLISGRNAEMLIGNHVIAAPMLRNSGIEVIPTGYLLIESGKLTSAHYMSNTTPIPRGKDDIAVCTAVAGEMLGLQAIYMDAGSGAENPVTGSMISNVKANISVPLFVGGGIRTPDRAALACESGADIVVAGNIFEKSPSLMKEMISAIQTLNMNKG